MMLISNGQLLVSCLDRCLYIYNSDLQLLKTIEKVSIIKAGVEMSKNRVILGSRNGIFEYLPETQELLYVMGRDELDCNTLL